jgi:dTDP-4-dehydrorhamnose reductase
MVYMREGSHNLKILILGASGMLGTDLGHEFESKCELFLWDKEELDVTNKEQVLAKIFDLKPNIIINATGYTDVDGAEDNKDLAFKLNGEAVGYLTDAAQSIGAKLIHFSTEYVFDGTDKNGYKENYSVNPLNVYGQSKAVGEKYVLEYNLGYLIRTSWLYGHAPQVGKPRGANFVDTMIKLSDEKSEIKVVDDQFGKLTNTRDLASAVYELVAGDFQPGIYHLVNEGVATWYNIAQEVFKIKNIKTPLISISSSEYPAKAKRPQYAVLFNTKFPQLRPWQEALREYLN